MFYAFDKPAGLAVHPAAEDVPDLVSWIKRQRSLPRGLKPAHRLDRGTSGVVVCGASPKARKTLNAALAQAEKRYVALVSGTVEADEGVFDRPMKDARRKRFLEATTLFQVRERLGRFTLLELRLVTGRKHQLRRHLADAGLPVVGDARYGKVRFERLWLHAESLALPDRTIEAPLPGVLADHLNALRESAEGSPPAQD